MDELALIMAPMGQDSRVAHLWTQRNTTGDLLSRLKRGKEVPETLSQTTRTPRRVLSYNSLGESTAVDM